MFRVAGLALAAVLMTAGVARADEFVRDDCRPYAPATTGLRFDTPEHARWYKRFWTGTCDHLPFCFAGSPNWNDIVGKLLTKGGPREQAALLPKVCRLGEMIGLEWSREKKIRKIATSDLRAFSSLLEASGDPLRGVDQVDAKARTMMTPR